MLPQLMPSPFKLRATRPTHSGSADVELGARDAWKRGLQRVREPIGRARSAPRNLRGAAREAMSFERPALDRPLQTRGA